MAFIVGQMTATNASARTVLLVNGFGHKPSLREQMHQTAGPKGLDVMHPFNGYEVCIGRKPRTATQTAGNPQLSATP